MHEIRTNCTIICTHLRNMGFDEVGMLSVVPESLLIDVTRRWDLAVQADALPKHLLDYGYLERVERGYRLTGEDLR